jgi:hypothetical protein
MLKHLESHKKVGGKMTAYSEKKDWPKRTLSDWKYKLKKKDAWPRRPDVRIVVNK